MKPGPTTEIWQDFEYVDFEVEREDWNQYRLTDGSILKNKFVLIDLIAEKGFKGKLEKAKEEKGKFGIDLQIRSTNAVGVRVKPNLRGPPSNKPYSIEELRASIIEEDIDFETIKETWNSYNVEDSIQVKAKNLPARISRTNKHDNVGLPIYVIDWSLDLIANPRKKKT